jgi:shikimate dehydrogenase
VRDVRILARDPARAAKAIGAIGETARFHPLTAVREAMAGADIVINASPLGMTGQSPMPDTIIAALVNAHPDAFVLDMVYSPVETPFLVAAHKLGFGSSDGLTMLVGQAREAFRTFFGATPSREHDAELREMLTR